MSKPLSLVSPSDLYVSPNARMCWESQGNGEGVEGGVGPQGCRGGWALDITANIIMLFNYYLASQIGKTLKLL